MVDCVDILVGNLIQSFKTIERYLLTGLTAGLVMFALAITDPEMVGSLELLFAPIESPAFLVFGVAMVAYFVCGSISAATFASRVRAAEALAVHDRRLVDSLSTYPSLVSGIGVVPLVLIGAVGAVGMLATYLLLSTTQVSPPVLRIVGSVLLGSPYVVLLGMAGRVAFRQDGRGKTVEKSVA